MLQINILGIHNKVQSAVGRHGAIQGQAAVKSIDYKILQSQQAVLISVMAADIIKQLLGGTAIGSMHLAMNIRMAEAAFYLHSIIKITGNYIRLAHKHHQRLNAHILRCQRKVRHRLCTLQVNGTVKNMLSLIHMCGKILKAQDIILHADNAMRFIKLLRHKFSLRQLYHTGKLRSVQCTAYIKAGGTQSASVLTCCSQHRINRKICHTSVNSQSAILGNMALGSQGTAAVGKKAEVVNIKTLAVIASVKSQTVKLQAAPADIHCIGSSVQRKLILHQLGQNSQLAVNMHLLLLFAGQILRNLLQLCVCRQYLLLKVIRTVSGNRTAAVLRAHIMQLHHVLRHIKRHTQLFRLIAFIGQGITAQHAKA